MVSKTLVCGLLLAGMEVSAAPSLMDQDHPDRVYAIPGYNAPLPSAWFSGFLDYQLEGQNIYTHYVFVEAEEIGEGDDEEKPLIYWSNGGPGASSMYGLLTELGPLLMTDESKSTADYRRTGIPTLFYNPFAWTRLGHLLIVDAPAPVGYSYCNNNLTSHPCMLWTDELASQNTYLALTAFFETKLRPRSVSESPISLYLTGESYAGIYIPTLARRFVEGGFPLDVAIDLKGFAVGDGCLGTNTGLCVVLGDERFDYWQVVFLMGHGQILASTGNRVIELCKGSTKRGFEAYLEDACQKELDKLKAQVGGFCDYDMYGDYPACEGFFNAMADYVRLEQVREALHIPPGSDFFEMEGFDYTPTEPDLTGFYKEQALGGKLRMLVYNGDTDPAVTSDAAQNWTSSLGLEETEEWRPWTIDGHQRVAGYATKYQGGALEFVTVRGAGHMVPALKPEAAFVMMKSWLSEVPFPIFVEERPSLGTKADGTARPFLRSDA